MDSRLQDWKCHQLSLPDWPKIYRSDKVAIRGYFFVYVNHKSHLSKIFIIWPLSVLSLSQTFTILAKIHNDSSRFELDGKIGVHRDGKKKIQQCLHVSSTVPQ